MAPISGVARRGNCVAARRVDRCGVSGESALSGPGVPVQCIGPCYQQVSALMLIVAALGRRGGRDRPARSPYAPEDGCDRVASFRAVSSGARTLPQGRDPARTGRFGGSRAV